jgi:hypothetical protein
VFGRAKPKASWRLFSAAVVALGFGSLSCAAGSAAHTDYRLVAAHAPVMDSNCTLGLLGLVCVQVTPVPLPCGVAGGALCTLLPTPTPPPLPTPTPPLPTPTPAPPPSCTASCSTSGGAPPGGGTTGAGPPAGTVVTTSGQQVSAVAAAATAGQDSLPVALAASTDPLRVPLQTESLSPPPLLNAGQIPWIWTLLVVLDTALATATFMVVRANRHRARPQRVAS